MEGEKNFSVSANVTNGIRKGPRRKVCGKKKTSPVPRKWNKMKFTGVRGARYVEKENFSESAFLRRRGGKVRKDSRV